MNEIKRVLKKGGFFQGTILSKENDHFGVGEVVAKNTYINKKDKGDKVHPHCYFDQQEIYDLIKPLKIIKLEHIELDRPGAYHWYIIADQKVTKINENTYRTEMAGLKFKVAHKRPHWNHWSYHYKRETYDDRIIGILENVLETLKIQRKNRELTNFF